MDHSCTAARQDFESPALEDIYVRNARRRKEEKKVARKILDILYNTDVSMYLNKGGKTILVKVFLFMRS